MKTVPAAMSQTLAVAHLADIRARIAELRTLETTLQLIAECRGDEDADCAIWELGRARLTRSAGRLTAADRQGGRGPAMRAHGQG